MNEPGVNWPEWLTAIGTLALAGMTFWATKVSLRLATQNSRTKLSVTAALLPHFTHSRDTPINEITPDDKVTLGITVTNECEKTVRLAYVYWQFDDTRVEHSAFGRGQSQTIQPKYIRNIKLPPYDGHTEFYSLELIWLAIDEDLAAIHSLFKSIKIVAILSTGELFESPVTGELARRLRHRASYIHNVNKGLSTPAT